MALTERKTELAIMADVKIELHKRGYHCTIEYPGFLSLDNVIPGKSYAFGTANEFWGYDIIGEDNEPVACGTSDIPVDSQNIQGIADYIVATVGGEKPSSKVDAVYNPQWGRTVQVDSELMDKVREYGYGADHTGGGCMAWHKPLPDDGWICLTCYDVELGSWGKRNEHIWLVGRYNKDGDAWILLSALSLEEALKLGERLPAPRNGETTSIYFEAVPQEDKSAE